MKKTRDIKGISLIVFVIIIVTLLILGYVIITLIQKNKETTTQDFGEWVQERTTIVRNDVVLEVGDRVNLKIDNKENGEEYFVNSYTGNWVVLGVEEGKLLLISTTEVKTEVDLYGKDGKTV